jgi:tetratricopeptide (TPR) repeat protein
MDIDKSIQSAINNLQAGNIQEAGNLLKEVLSVQPDNINALHFLGLFYYETGDYDLAAEYILQALQRNPSYADAYNNLGLVLQKKGNPDNAIACYQKALDLNPDFESAHHNLRTLLIEGGYVDKAIKEYNGTLTDCIEFMKTVPDEFSKNGIRLKFLITGTGRCGTGYMAKLLASAGIPCGHEEIFSFLVNTDKLISTQLTGESSWLAVPFLSSPWLRDITLIHAVRNPLLTVQSLIDIRFFIDKNFFSFFAESFLPQLKLLHPDRAPFFYFMEWNKMILQYENYDKYIRHRVEDDPVPLIKRLRGNTSSLFSNTQYNTRRIDRLQRQMTPDDIPSEFKTEFLEISERIGYKF